MLALSDTCLRRHVLGVLRANYYSLLLQLPPVQMSLRRFGSGR
jgi:hypothetical protein